MDIEVWMIYEMAREVQDNVGGTAGSQAGDNQ
jgi:hypothetical protein